MSYTHITHENRLTLAALLRTTWSQKEIAEEIGKDPSSIGREVERNKDDDGIYRALHAEKRVKKRRVAANQRFRKIENDTKLRRYIVAKLKLYWSPEQIAGRWRKKEGKGAISHQTIYDWVYEKRKDLVKCLRCRKGKFRRRRGTRIREKQREEMKKRRIDTRPPIVEKRERIGDWEGDTIVGGEKTQRLLTHVERKSGYLLADKLNVVTAEIVREKTACRFQSIPKKKCETITYDNGIEFSDHAKLEEDTGITIYFAYPYHSWERGTNENTNGLLRQFFPKGSSFAMITQQRVEHVARLINNRPRKRLNYLTPREIFKNHCALD